MAIVRHFSAHAYPRRRPRRAPRRWPRRPLARTRGATRRNRSSSASRSRSSGLWREAIYRWERAAQIDPTYAAALNNLAIAYEHEGDLDKARVAYEKALELEPNNALIKQNYELFKEINDRTTRKDTQIAWQPVLSSVAAALACGLHELLRDSDRDAHPAEARRVGVPARARRRLHRGRHRRRGRQPRDDAPAAQPAADQVRAPRHRCRCAAADGSRDRGPGRRK